ncbi:MAG: hypothetical protein M1834_008595 [Cirrosporium novae-zelandiae]|nr:MAG: hypothetical protein M1834_008595 [Cirrosporium novae-zelandiae]
MPSEILPALNGISDSGPSISSSISNNNNNNNNPFTSNHASPSPFPPTTTTTATTTITTSSSSLEEICSITHAQISQFLATPASTELLHNVQKQTRASLDVISEALRRYDLSSLSLSYNGGKDCLVLLILYLSAIYTHFCPQPQQSPPKTLQQQQRPPEQPVPFPLTLQSTYIPPPSPFPTVTSFVQRTSQTYHLSLSSTGPTSSSQMKNAFSTYLESHPQIKGIFVGTRRTDPHGEKLTFFDETDHGWPRFMRIHPVIEWHYTEIWAFLRHLQIPYCSLYDLGYTSLGGTNDTHPNPALLLPSGKPGEGSNHVEHQPRYRPAYELIEDTEERLGRES